MPHVVRQVDGCGERDDGPEASTAVSETSEYLPGEILECCVAITDCLLMRTE